MRKLGITVLAACIAMPAAAHDFWLQPASFWVRSGAPVGLSLLVGHGANRQLWDADIRRMTRFYSVGPAGTAELSGSIRQGGAGQVALLARGVHVLALETSHAQSDLPAIRFEDYLRVEGLTPAIEARRLSSRTDQPGREIYSRRAKALVRVGGGPAVDEPHVTAPLGLTLEIVPERNPYAVPTGEALPFRIYYQGRPLEGALVKLTNLGADEEPAATSRSNASGRVAFTMPRRGAWQLNVVWTRPITGNPTADFDTTFSSLTFGFDAPPAA
ncbi:MAG: hypothetical protein B7Z01_13065 [Brevundimonas subvibrioides]|uniref:DUF4198 domain-containing protein n=2 Tax=Brevundimonas TaxID=41275 RepID=A0A258FF10_9CAUL|nr:MAG: hypothetical protein B7Z01_13065 [Brevundimonas subvibrioides]